MHVFHHAQVGQLFVDDFLDDERLRNHADDVAAVSATPRPPQCPSGQPCRRHRPARFFRAPAIRQAVSAAAAYSGACLLRSAKNGDALHGSSALRTAAMNARTFAWSFFPGELSTPLETSTPNGRTLSHGVGDVFRRQSSGEKNWLAEFLRFNRQVPVEFFARAAARFRRIGIEQIRVG
jgi:hypothetical protein